MKAIVESQIWQESWGMFVPGETEFHENIFLKNGLIFPLFFWMGRRNCFLLFGALSENHFILFNCLKVTNFFINSE